MLLCAAALLTACGGSSTDSNNSDNAKLLHAAPLATGSTTIEVSTGTVPSDIAKQQVLPTFHVAPLLLDTPEDDTHGLSAYREAHRQAVPAEFQQLSTRRLTLQALRARHEDAMRGVTPDQAAASLTKQTAITYTPAQIRAAYGLPALPAAGATLTAAQAAQLGAGQTVYIVDAYDDPNTVAELAAFNQKFGLPLCTTKVIASTASLPLPAASATACELSVVYSTASGTMTPTRPTPDAGWATEMALDVQWVHATAPLARIVLIEAADTTSDQLTGSVKLANTMGAGTVSMSFGGSESSGTTAAYDAAFSQTNMTYLAATGDSGTGVLWPSVSQHVLAVGGTTLSYSGSGKRSEVAWSGTGGGVSQFTATPSYQSNGVPGMGTPTHRTVADVSFNADPYSGQYVAVIPQGSIMASWISVGGTSMATPQWAGVIAIANALRVQAGKNVVGAPHAVLYSQIATVPGTYASDFADIISGSDGSCAACSAKTAYDQVTGLGTPNATTLLSTLSGASITVAPVVPSATVNGTVGTPLSFTVSSSATNPVSYTLSGAPSGLTISSAGAVTWAVPVAGTYAVTVKVTDSKNGLSGSGLYTIIIAAPTTLPKAPLVAPVVPSATVNGTVGMPLSFTVSSSATNPVSYTLSGAPSGLTISSAGAVTWAVPVAGTYAVTVKATDSKNGLSGSGLYTIIIAAPTTLPKTPPSGGTQLVSGRVGTPLSFSVAITDSNPVAYKMSGATAGITIAGSQVSWASPVAGSYMITITANDLKTGASTQILYMIQITNGGPVITGGPMTGVAGQPFVGIINISDPGPFSMSITIGGAPMGMMWLSAGSAMRLVWNNPTAGNYSLNVSVKDSLGGSAQLIVPFTVTAH